MALNSYSALKTSVADWLNRADLAAAVPDFIALAEAQISRRLLMMGPVRRMLTRTAITVDSEFEDVPEDFMGLKSMYLNTDGVSQMKFLLPEQMNEKKGRSSEVSGNPRYVSVVGGQYQFYPAPSESVTGEQEYWARIPALSDSNTTNWLLTLHPDAYLYGALLQAAPYLKDDARIQVWGGAFETILSDIVSADKIERDSTYLAVPDASFGTP